MNARNARQFVETLLQAWRRLQISPTHLDLIKDLPANFTIVLLQHNADG